MASEYLTYEEYQAYGGSLSANDFRLAEFKARKRIDYLTNCRVQHMAEIPEAVKLCIMSVIQVNSKVGLDAMADSPLIASYSTDGYSESYGSVTEQIGAMQKSVDTTVRHMLYGVLDDHGVPLLYRGVDAC